jgi:mono/diheme cytochrome c family protein
VKLNLQCAAILCLAASIAAPAFAQGAGADTYKTKCVGCHGADGTASPIGKKLLAPSFKDPAVVKNTDAQLIALVKSGKNKMPEYADKLSDAQIKSVVAYIRTLQK